MQLKSISMGRLPAVVAVILTLLLGLTTPGLTQRAAPHSSAAPVNPKFSKYIYQVGSDAAKGKAKSERPSGLIPSPVNPPKGRKTSTTSSTTRSLTSAGSATISRPIVGLPTSYDLRTQSRVTPVRDQGTCGSCWSFATYASLESCLMPGESWDFSENNMKNTAGFDLNSCAGGNEYISTAYLARWSGAVSEDDDPYNPYSSVSVSGAPVHKHIQTVDFLPDRHSSLDNDVIKQAVMTYGGVYTTMYSNDRYYNANTHAFYYNGPLVSNHSVCIVGWDDNFDKSKFLTTPPGNGAFLIKNSWGSDWGDNGYFYISYYDSNIGMDNTLFRAAEPATNYDHIYQYDWLGWTQSVGYDSDTAWFASVFTAGSDEQLAAVSLYTATTNCPYELRVYLNPDSGPINSSGPIVTQTGVIARAGYQTVPLNTFVSLVPGQSFSVVVKLTTPDYNYPVALESPVQGYSNKATANYGETYMSSDGDMWSDTLSTYSRSNVCLKAFTVNDGGLVVTPGGGMDSKGPAGGPFSQSSQVYTLTNTGDSDIDWSAECNAPWMSLSSTGGSLHPGESGTVTASLNSTSATLTTGVYSGVIDFVNVTNGAGSTSRPVDLAIRNGMLSVTPEFGLDVVGEGGGPFSPLTKTYTLTNKGYSSLNWTASKNQSWVNLSATSGTLAPGESTTVTLNLISDVNSLAVGSHSCVVTFTNATTGEGTVDRTVSLAVVRNYQMISTVCNWIDPSGHTPITLADDAASGSYAIPFPFSFYDAPCSQVYVGSNGIVGFTNKGMGEVQNTDLPNASPPNNVICAYWDDLNPVSSGSISVGTTGTEPNRRFVISWVGVPHFSSAGWFTFQVVLCETTNDIILQYQEVQPGDLINGAGVGATVGIENADGTVARKYSYKGSNLLSNHQAILFTMSPSSGVPDVRRLPNGAPVAIRNTPITAVTSTSQFYIESDDRSSGICVYKPMHGLLVGMKADVQGAMATSGGGERYISANSALQSGTLTLPPVMMPNRMIGGSDWAYNESTGAGQKGMKDGTGLNNIGLFITTFGRVTYAAPGYYFYINDGSSARDTSGYTGTKVLGTIPVADGVDPVGKYVKVTGVISCFKVGSDLYPQVRATDITVLR